MPGSGASKTERCHVCLRVRHSNHHEDESVMPYRFRTLVGRRPADRRSFGGCFTIGFSSIASPSTRARTWRAITPCRSGQPSLAGQLLSVAVVGSVAAAARRARCFQRSRRPLRVSWNWRARSAGQAIDQWEAVEMLSLASLWCIRTVSRGLVKRFSPFNEELP